MTPFEKLVWLQANTCSVHIDMNDHRSAYVTVEEELSEKGYGRRYDDLDPEVRAECIKRNQLVAVQCYPSTPVGFFCVTHWDLEQAIDRVYQAVSSDPHFTPYVVTQ